MPKWRALLACLTAGAAALAACGSASTTTRGTTRVIDGETVVGGRSQLTFRPVIRGLPLTGLPSTTPAGKVTSRATVVLDGRDAAGHVTGRYELGPVLLDGRILDHATAVQNQEGLWQVEFVTTQQGSRAFDAMALTEYQHQVALVVGDLVLEAPQINATSFHGSGQITGDFTAEQAKALAALLNTPG
ncbi:MAG TPA: hypothetical protein VFH50_04060 [Acidimicrobiales bacterium]|nr:hypothetical protein [Acidimicrobiales bacterium]